MRFNLDMPLNPDGDGPKTIYSLWMQGRDQAPEIVRFNFDRWESLNPTYKLVVLEEADVGRLLRDCPAQTESVPMQALSDVVRVRLLADSGGIWVDASVLPIKPLDEWLPQLARETGFFAFERPAPDRPIASWFLAASPGHPLIQRWWVEVQRYWSRPRDVEPCDSRLIPPEPTRRVAPDSVQDTAPYFWFHYLFGYLVESDQEMAEVWARCAKVSAVPPHALQRLFAENKGPKTSELVAAALQAPVQKLDWRYPYPLELMRRLERARPPGVLQRLFKR